MKRYEEANAQALASVDQAIKRVQVGILPKKEDVAAVVLGLRAVVGNLNAQVSALAAAMGVRDGK